MKKTIVEIFSEVDDYRTGNAVRHKLVDVLMIGLLSILCGGGGYAAMKLFGDVHGKVLQEFLELPFGIPSQDTFERVFANLNPQTLREKFKTFVDEVIDAIKGNINVSIDGKTVCGSKSCEKKALHVVTAFASDLQLVLGELATDEKSNEITAIPKLLEMFCRKGMTITIDAMGTQTDIAEKIIDCGGEYVLAVKGNQPTLFDDISLYLETEVISQDKQTLEQEELYAKTDVEKGHGRIETRQCFVCHDVDWLESKPLWKNLSGFGVVISKREVLGKTPEISHRYFIFSNAKTTALDLLSAVRSHWAIENNLHWHLDMTLNEDASRARIGNSQENLNIIRKEVLQMLKADTSVKGSLESKRLRCSWDLLYALKIVGVK